MLRVSRDMVVLLICGILVSTSVEVRVLSDGFRMECVKISRDAPITGSI